MPYETEGNTDWRNVKQAGATKVKAGDVYYEWDEESLSYKDAGSTKSVTKMGITSDVYVPPSDSTSYVEPITFTADMSSMETYAGTGLTEGGGIEGFTYTGGQFDPTSEEFISSAKSGSTTDLLQGLGIGAEYYKYFDDPDLEQLDLMERGYDLQEDKLSSEASGALSQVKTQGQKKISAMNFATATGTETAIQDATSGVWGEYQTQKDTLAIDEKSALRQFWQAEEDQFYSTVDEVESKIDAESSGGGGSCFIGDSPVLMSNGAKKKIKDIVKGDKIKGWGNKIHTVVELRPEKLAGRKLYGFNGSPAFFTEEHPLMTIDGWKSLNPKETKRENPIMEIERFQVGDTVMGGKKVKDLGYIYTPILVETIESKEDDPDTDVYNIHLSDGISFHVYNIPFHTVQSGVVVDKYAEEGLSNLSDEDKQRFATAFSTVPGLMDATGRAFGSTFIKIFRQLGA